MKAWNKEIRESMMTVQSTLKSRVLNSHGWIDGRTVRDNVLGICKKQWVDFA